MDNNRIKYVEGLENLTKLEELHISHQQLEENESLEFSDKSMLALRDCLRILNASHNRIKDIDPLKWLKSIKKINLSHNEIDNFEQVESVLQANLEELDLSGCPITKVKKYTEEMLLRINDYLSNEKSY